MDKPLNNAFTYLMTLWRYKMGEKSKNSLIALTSRGPEGGKWHTALEASTMSKETELSLDSANHWKAQSYPMLDPSCLRLTPSSHLGDAKKWRPTIRSFSIKDQSSSPFSKTPTRCFLLPETALKDSPSSRSCSLNLLLVSVFVFSFIPVELSSAKGLETKLYPDPGPIINDEVCFILVAAIENPPFSSWSPQPTLLPWELYVWARPERACLFPSALSDFSVSSSKSFDHLLWPSSLMPSRSSSPEFHFSPGFKNPSYDSLCGDSCIAFSEVSAMVNWW